MEIKELNASEIRRGMMVAEDVLDNGKILVDKETMLSGNTIAQIRKRGIEKVKILIKDIPKAEAGEEVVGVKFKVDEVKESIENVLLFDPETDDEMKFMKTIMSLGKSKDPRAVEALDFVINYVDIERARELAAEGLVNLRCEEAVPALILCMKDELPKVRAAALKSLTREADDFVVERLICAMDSDTSKESSDDIYKALSSFPAQMVKEVCENLVDNGSPNYKIQAREVLNRLKLNT